MRIDVVTIFPDMFREVFEFGIVRRAREAGLVSVHVHDLRSWTKDRHRTTDDAPYGGGPGIRSQTGPTWVGELFFNFGWSGVVLGMFVLGVYFRVLNGTVYQHAAPLPLQWTAVAAAYYVVPAVNSSLTPPINVVPFYGGVILAIHLIVVFVGGTVPFRSGAAAPSVPASS